MGAAAHWHAARPALLGLLMSLALAACSESESRTAESGTSAAALMLELEPVAIQSLRTAALASQPPSRITMSDEIDFLRARLAEQSSHGRWVSLRLVGAYLLRFRAYGAQPDLEAARRHLESVEVGGETPELWSLRSSIALLEHDFVSALESARQANRLLGDFDSALRLRLFDALWAYGSYDEAQRLLELPHDRASFDYLVREARVLDRLGRTAEARDNLEAALLQAEAYAEPKAVVAWTLTELGHFEHHSGRPGVAAERYLESLELLPGNPSALAGLAGLSAGVGRDFQTAVQLYAHALRSGAHLDLYLDLADAYDALDEPHKATLARDRFIEHATSSPNAKLQFLRPLALVLADHYSDRLEEARSYAELDLSQRPALESWDALAWVRYRMGDLGAALSASRKATAWGVPEPIVLYHAGVIADEAGDMERGAVLLQAALDASTELSPGELEDVRRRLMR